MPFSGAVCPGFKISIDSFNSVPYNISLFDEMSTGVIMRELVNIFKALSDSNRLRIIKMLENRPLCVCEITAILKLAPSTISKHLSILRQVNLILDDKDGKWVNYRLNQDKYQAYIPEILQLLQRWLPSDETVTQDKQLANEVNRHQLCSR
jgi:ArsR family transcriptional regulator